MPAPSEPMHIAILGAGNIGTAFAFQLARIGGHRITLIARPASRRLEQLQHDNAIIDTANNRAEITIADTLDEQIPYDLLLITLLAHQAMELLPTLQRCAAKHIQFMANNFHPERLQAAVGATSCSFGMPFIQALLMPDGKLRATIGAGGQKTIMDRPQSVDLFNAAGIPAAHEPNMLSWLRCHTPVCVAFQSISVAAQNRGAGATRTEALIVARGVLSSYSLIKALGYEIYPTTKRRIAASPLWIIATTLWAMSRIRSFRELLATGRAECLALIEAFATAATTTHPPCDLTAIKAVASIIA